MPNLASSNAAWGNALARDAAGEAEVRRSYARKRSAEHARQRTLALTRIVETDIIPKLKLLHPGLAPAAREKLPKPDTHHVDAFAQLLLGPDVSAASDAFTARMAEGYSAESLFLDLLAPAASLLGRLWDEDLCDFLEVATGVAHLQALVCRFRSGAGVAKLDDKRHVLLMGAPGELHTFGTAIVEQFLQVAGWQVVNGLASSPDEIASLVGERWFGVVGLALSCESRLDGLSAAIRSVRKMSLNSGIGVMVGGPVFLADPQLVERVGADASAVDAPTAVLLAQRLLDIGLAHSPGSNVGAAV